MKKVFFQVSIKNFWIEIYYWVGPSEWARNFLIWVGPCRCARRIHFALRKLPCFSYFFQSFGLKVAKIQTHVKAWARSKGDTVLFVIKFLYSMKAIMQRFKFFYSDAFMTRRNRQHRGKSLVSINYNMNIIYSRFFFFFFCITQGTFSSQGVFKSTHCPFLVNMSSDKFDGGQFSPLTCAGI